MENAKVLNAQIILRQDTLQNWNNEDSLVLLKGEVALAELQAGQQNPITGRDITVPTYMMKVGDGVSKFSSLNWFMATAADVHEWAKKDETEFTDWVKTLINVEDVDLSNYYTKGEVDEMLGGISVEIVDSLESADSDKALSANQGRVLNEKFDGYVKNTDYASTTAPGVVKIASGTGIYMYNGTTLAVSGATKDGIRGKTNASSPICPTNLDNAVYYSTHQDLSDDYSTDSLSTGATFTENKGTLPVSYNATKNYIDSKIGDIESALDLILNLQTKY